LRTDRKRGGPQHRFEQARGEDRECVAHAAATSSRELIWAVQPEAGEGAACTEAAKAIRELAVTKGRNMMEAQGEDGG
jgi:hypothetical protein